MTAKTHFRWICSAAAIGAAIIGTAKGHPNYIGIPLFCGFWVLFDLLFVKLERVADAAVSEEDYRAWLQRWRARLQRWRLPGLSEAMIETAVRWHRARPMVRRLVSNCGLALIALGGLVDALVR